MMPSVFGWVHFFFLIFVLTLVFFDIAPSTLGHMLIVPKNHFANIEEIDQESLGLLMTTAKKIAAAFKNSQGLAGYNLIINNGKVAGQLVNHLHLHLIPRYEDDGLEAWGHGEYQGDSSKKIADEINNYLNNK